MKEQRLTKILKAGYPRFKENSGVPVWLLPERSFAIVVDGLGDTTILEGSRCLDLLPDTANKIPDHESFSAGMWREACLDWPQLSLVSAIITSLLESVDQVMAKHYRGELTIETQVIFRSLMVIAFAYLRLSIGFRANGRTPLILLNGFIRASVITLEKKAQQIMNHLLPSPLPLASSYLHWTIISWRTNQLQSASTFHLVFSQEHSYSTGLNQRFCSAVARKRIRG